jgi:glycosyltransferase involved in cell wall biosynthesis
MNPQRLTPQPALDLRAVFVGSLSSHHQQRQRLLDQLQAQGIDLYITRAPQVQAAQLYNRHAISLNVSLNGDLNFRIMEVLAAGGCLLTDRLGPDSGLNLLLEENVHYLAYSSAAEAAEKIHWLKRHPEQRLAIAQAGHQRFWNHFSPEIQAQALLAALGGAPIPSLFQAPR